MKKNNTGELIFTRHWTLL